MASHVPTSLEALPVAQRLHIGQSGKLAYAVDLDQCLGLDMLGLGGRSVNHDYFTIFVNLKQDCCPNMQVVSTRTTEVVIACKLFIPESRNA